jgi:hypothetical protein
MSTLMLTIIDMDPRFHLASAVTGNVGGGASTN